MKIATYHRLQGHHVQYISGTNAAVRDEHWDKVYITSVFTYNYSSFIKTVHFYSKNAAIADKIQVGGIAATLLADQVAQDARIVPHKGLLDAPDPFLTEYANQHEDYAYLHDCCPSIDNLPPAYDIFPKQTKYLKLLDRSYFFYTTKGCPNKCGFCAVKTLEPIYVPYIPIAPRIKIVADNYGEKPGLLLLDNNIAESEQFFRIMDEIKDCGFGNGAVLTRIKNGRSVKTKRFVDFNQGVDLRLMTPAKMRKMAEIAIAPLRLAFDDISLAELYEEKMELAISCGITDLSNYMLFNYKDSPEDLYHRFAINLRILSRHEGVKIFSFPMRYSPIHRTDRKHVGKHWTKREIRAVQLVLQATHGIVSHKLPFFSRAFGRDLECFKKVLLYPYHYIINRDICEYRNMLLQQWEADYAQLGPAEQAQFKEIIKDGPLETIPATGNSKINALLEHYEGEYARIMTDEEFMRFG
jgi:hypothetical protein